MKEIGYYFIGVGLTFFASRMIEGVNALHFLFTFAGGWAVALVNFGRMLKRRTSVGIWSRRIITTFFGFITAWCAAVASLFNPLAVRPSPIPLPERTLDSILVIVNVVLVLLGVLFIRKK